MSCSSRFVPLLLGLTLTGCAQMPSTARLAPTSEEVMELAPPIQGVDSRGEEMSLSEYRGKVVLLDFWRTG